MLKIENAIKKEIENKNPKYLNAYNKLYIQYKNLDLQERSTLAPVFQQVYMPRKNGLYCIFWHYDSVS